MHDKIITEDSRQIYISINYMMWILCMLILGMIVRSHHFEKYSVTLTYLFWLPACSQGCMCVSKSHRHWTDWSLTCGSLGLVCINPPIWSICILQVLFTEYCSDSASHVLHAQVTCTASVEGHMHAPHVFWSFKLLHAHIANHMPQTLSSNFPRYLPRCDCG